MLKKIIKKISAIITIASVKGGVGKSTLILNLIIEYSKTQKVNVIDLDKNRSVTTSLLIRKKVLPAELSENINLIEVSNTKELIDAMIRVNGEGGLLFIDQGGFDTELNRVATSGADLLLTATNDSFFELNGFVEFAKILKEINEDIRNQHGYELVANVIPCKIHPSVRNIEHIKDFVDKTPGFAMMNSVIKSFKNYGLAPGAGQSVVEYAEYDSSSINFLEFKKEVDNIIK